VTAGGGCAAAAVTTAVVTVAGVLTALDAGSDARGVASTAGTAGEMRPAAAGNTAWRARDRSTREDNPNKRRRDMATSSAEVGRAHANKDLLQQRMLGDDGMLAFRRLWGRRQPAPVTLWGITQSQNCGHTDSTFLDVEI
jgi:hypothetical protein